MKKYVISTIGALGALLGLISIFLMVYRPTEHTQDVQLVDAVSHLHQQGLTGNQAGVFVFPQGSTLLVLANSNGEYETLSKYLSYFESEQLLSDNHLADQTYLLFNGSEVGDFERSGQILNKILTLINLNEGSVYYLRGAKDRPHDAWTSTMSWQDKQLLERFYSRLMVGAFIYAYDQKAPLLIAPQGSAPDRFKTVVCRPTGRVPLVSLCALDALCSFTLDPVATLNPQSDAYMITFGATQHDSVVTRYRIDSGLDQVQQIDKQSLTQFLKRA